MYEVWLLVAAIVGFGMLVLVHELGHFGVARWFKMAVDRFSIGFGPVLFRKRVGETDYEIGSIPAGGFVSILGEPGSGGDGYRQKLEKLTKGRSKAESRSLLARSRRVRYRSWRQQFALAFAGPLASLALGFALFFGLALGWGRLTEGQSNGMHIASVLPGSPAEAAGLLADDVITSVNGREVHTFTSFSEEVIMGSTSPLALGVLSNGAHRTVMLTTVEEFDEVMRMKSPRLGVTLNVPPPTLERVGILGAFSDAWHRTTEMVAMQVRGVHALLTGRIPLTKTQGPVAMLHVTGVAAMYGLVPYVSLLAVLSIGLAVMNLLPILPLDGGRMLFALIHGARGKPVPARVQLTASCIGGVLMVGLMLLTVANDTLSLS